MRLHIPVVPTTVSPVARASTSTDLARGARIAKARENRSLGQAELARALGVSTTTAWRWENEGTPPRGRHLGDLAEALGVTEHWILTGEEGDSLPEVPRALRDLFEHRPDLRARVDAKLEAALIRFAARNGIRPKTWHLWQNIVVAWLEAKTSPVHQEKREKRKSRVR